MTDKRIPLKGGDEYDALTKAGKRVHSFRPGERKRTKRGYWHRFRAMIRAAIRKEKEQ